MLRSLIQPTLARRLSVTLLGVSLLVWLVLVLYYFMQETSERASVERIHERGRALMLVLQDLPSHEQAAAAAAHFDALFNTPFRGTGQRGFFLEVHDEQGSIVYRAMTAPALQGRPGEIQFQTIAAQPFRVYRFKAAAWDVQIAMQGPQPWLLLQALVNNLTISVVLAFPIILLPLLFAVRRGLTPLQQLSNLLATRSPDDLQPVAVPVAYLELQPLIDALNHLLAKLKQKIEREHRFVQDAAHELRTPLAVITAQAHALSQLSNATERQAACNDLERAVLRSSELIDQLLLLARLDAQQPLQLQSLDVAAFCQQLLADFALVALAADVEVSLQAPDQVWHTTDATLLHTIVQNLLTNALKYAAAGKQLEVELKVSEDTLRLEVADAGPGIAKAQQQAIFERFYRVPGSQGAGAGLGLAIVNQAVACLQGRLWLTTGIDGRGCRFVIELPKLARTGVAR